MYEVFGLGNALVDTEVNIDDGFLATHGIAKSHMTLIEADVMQTLIQAVAELPQKRASGGSAANTIFAINAFGNRACYTCKLGDDQTGDFFVSDISASGVGVNDNAQSPGGTSGQCLVLITDDAERSMMTHLGISVELGQLEVNDEVLGQAKQFYVEGYMAASPSATAASVYCREVCEANKAKVAVSLSDVSMIQFCRDGLVEMLGNGIDQLFCNEEEALAWAGTDRLDIALQELKDIACEVYVTLGAKGSIAMSRDGTHDAPGVVVKPVDTTGAGDIYAGACLAARAQGASALDAARFANHCAAELITHYGARLQTISDYQQLRAQFR